MSTTKIDIDYLAKVKLDEGDTLVLKLAHPASPEQLERMRAALAGRFTGHPVIVLEPGIDLDVVSGIVEPSP